MSLGIIGGLGPAAGAYYYRRLLESANARSEKREPLLVPADLRTVLDYANAGDGSGLARYLATLLELLADSGCDLAAISAVTPHVCIAELTSLASMPIVNLLSAVRAAVEERGVRKVVLFGTRVVMESALFGSLSNVEVVPPTAAEVDAIETLYSEIAFRGGGQVEREALAAAADRIIRRERVDAVLLAGTDLSALFESDPPDFPAIDAADVHLAAIRKSWLAA